MLVWQPEGLQWLIVLAATVVVYEVVRSVLVTIIKRRFEAQIDRFLRRNEIPTDAFRHTHRVVVKEMVLTEPRLAAAIEERAIADGLPPGEVRVRVRHWLDEIVPQFNLFAYYKIGYSIARMAAYSVYDVRLDEDSLRRARAALPKDAAVVYVSNHRSNADFVVTGFMLSKSVQVSYAVGEWARVWPLEKLFKSFGSYFVRRGEKDPLYHQTLESYIQLVTKQAVTQAMFPEGGLSRDGALRPVKLGLLDNMAKAKLDPRFHQPLVFVPVGINFDRVLEDEVLIQEDAGQIGRPRRSVGTKLLRMLSLTGKAVVGLPINTVRFLTGRLKRHGIVAIHFGEPVVFDDWYAAQEPFLDEPDRHVRWEHLRPFGEDLLRRIGGNIPATPVSLACLAATRLGQERMNSGVERGDFLIALRAVHDGLAAAGAPFATEPAPRGKRKKAAVAVAGKDPHHRDLAHLSGGVDASDDLAAILDRALDVTKERGLLQQEDGRIESLATAWPLVEYYANSLRAHLAGPDGADGDAGQEK